MNAKLVSFSMFAAALIALAQPAFAQNRRTIFFSTFSYTDGTYGLRVGGLPLGVGTSMVAPDGTVFGLTPPIDLSRVSGLTQAEFVNRFAGNWTMNDAGDFLGNPAPLQVHAFSITADSLLAFPVRPTVLSPSEGAIVPREFTATWVNGRSFTAPGIPLSFISVSGTAATVRLTLPDGVNQQLVGINAVNSAGNRVLATTNAASPRYRYDIDFDRYSYSETRNITVLNVPEPATLAIAGVAASGVVTLGRRRQ
jgi:hypothetical protein